MAQAALSDEDAAEAARQYRESGGNLSAAARAAGMPRPTFENRLRRAAERGMLGTKPVLPGFRISKTTAVTGKNGEIVREFVQQRPEAGPEFAMPEGQQLKAVSALVDANGNVVQQWVKTREGQLDPRQVAEWLKSAFDDYKPRHKAAKPPKAVNTDLLTLFPANDWHMGMFAWGKETAENWDLKIAEETIGDAVEDTISRSPRSSTAIVLGGGDLLHSDNNENKTARSGNVLQVDGRYQKAISAAGRLMVRTVDIALTHHEHVIVRILPGNHDEHASVAIAYFLLAWYRNEPRVTVDVDPSLFFRHRFGLVLLGATHGHTLKVKDMPMLMAHRWAEDWGATKFRYVHGFHLHHSAKIATEGNGCICEVHQAPIPQDAWHFGAGFLSGRSLQAITYHREFGEIGRVRTAILDAGK